MSHFNLCIFTLTAFLQDCHIFLNLLHFSNIEFHLCRKSQCNKAFPMQIRYELEKFETNAKTSPCICWLQSQI